MAGQGGTGERGADVPCLRREGRVLKVRALHEPVVHLAFRHSTTTLCGVYRFDRNGRRFNKPKNVVPSCLRCIAYDGRR